MRGKGQDDRKMVATQVRTSGDRGKEKGATAQTEVQRGGPASGRINTRGKGRRGEERERDAADEEVCQGTPGVILLSRQQGRLPTSVVGIKITQYESWGGKLIKQVAELLNGNATARVVKDKDIKGTRCKGDADSEKL